MPDTPAPTPETIHYQRPGWFTRNLFNRAVVTLTKLGVSVWGSRELRVRGRKSGEWRTTPVNLLDLDGQQFLVAPRGRTQWVLNLRAAGDGRAAGRAPGRGASGRPRSATTHKVAVLRAYLRRWKMEVGVFFDGVGPDASDEEIRAIATATPSSASDSRVG